MYTYTWNGTEQEEIKDIPAFIYLSAALSQSGFHFNQLVFIMQKKYAKEKQKIIKKITLYKYFEGLLKKRRNPNLMD